MELKVGLVGSEVKLGSWGCPRWESSRGVRDKVGLKGQRLAGEEVQGCRVRGESGWEVKQGVLGGSKVSILAGR